MAPLFDLVLKHVEPPKVGAGGFRMLGTLLEANPYLGPHHYRARLLRLDPHQRAGQGAGPQGDLVETGPCDQNPGLPRHRARPDRRSGRRRHRGRGRAGEVQRRRHPLQPRRGRAADRPADRPANAVDDLFRQRQSARRHRGRQGDEPRHPRPSVSRRRRAMSRSRSRRPPTPTPTSSPGAANCSSRS